MGYVQVLIPAHAFCVEISKADHLSACGRCQKRNDAHHTCIYDHSSNSPMNLPSQAHTLVTAPSPLPSAPAGATLMNGDTAQTRGSYSDFAAEVRSAIDTNSGLPSAESRCPIPLIDAPLFGEGPFFGSLGPGHAKDRNLHADYVLPARKSADNLVNLYWRHIEPIEPLLDRGRFFRSYQTLFDGTELDCDELIFVSTLNTVFALSTQLQETIEATQRDETSKKNFDRAWSLLRPEVIVWKPGSLELVQCLLLMSRYLQCTRNVHQTWMAVGSAVRIAQSLGLHVVDRTPFTSHDEDELLRRKVWQCCESTDRYARRASKLRA